MLALLLASVLAEMGKDRNGEAGGGGGGAVVEDCDDEGEGVVGDSGRAEVEDVHSEVSEESAMARV
ncbi:hypothetical protein QQ045_003743 [Rhodiola kirilowii]